MRLVIPSVRYADFLAVTLPAWQRTLPKAKITVVTSPADLETPKVAEAYGVRCLVSDAWQEDGATFNKGGALDEAFGFRQTDRRRPATGERCLAIDADVYPVGDLPDDLALERGILYGCPRYACETPADLEAHLAGLTRREELGLIRAKLRGESAAGVIVNAHPAVVTRTAKHCLGFFQLFRFMPGIKFGWSKTAGKYDMTFRRHFGSRAAVPDFYVLHLGEQHRDNWRGRVVAPWPPTVATVEAPALEVPVEAASTPAAELEVVEPQALEAVDAPIAEELAPPETCDPS